MFEITVLSLFPHTFSHTCCQNRLCLRLRLYFRRPQARPCELLPAGSRGPSLPVFFFTFVLLLLVSPKGCCVTDSLQPCRSTGEKGLSAQWSRL